MAGKIVQHRDTLRYATISGRGYLPSVKEFLVGEFAYLRLSVITSTLQIVAKREIHKVKMVKENGDIQLQGKCGMTMMNNVCNMTPCHLPIIDLIVDHTLARPDQNLAYELCAFKDEEEFMLLCLGCGTGWNMMCLNPKLNKVPKDDWLSPHCLEDGVTGQDL